MNNKQKEKLVKITIDSDTIQGDMVIPGSAEGIVLFAHGAGSSRNSVRNNFVAEELQEAKFATLLIDLLTDEEKKIDQQTREFRFDIDRLSKRVTGTIDWLSENEETKDFKTGVFGSSTGAAGSVIAAAQRPERVRTVVSRGGRVDMAEGYLAKVKSTVLCIVGGRDTQVLALNRQAISKMETDAELKVIEGAGHLFEEAGAIEKVAQITQEWFKKYLTK
jgi:pimeloyl-ACP methyl ester carboxylesterase